MAATSSTRQAAVWIAAGTIVFSLSLIAFCWALGLNFRDEGWSEPAVDHRDAASQSQWWVISMIGFIISIVVFFVGVQKLAK